MRPNGEPSAQEVVCGRADTMMTLTNASVKALNCMLERAMFGKIEIIVLNWVMFSYINTAGALVEAMTWNAIC